MLIRRRLGGGDHFGRRDGHRLMRTGQFLLPVLTNRRASSGVVSFRSTARIWPSSGWSGGANSDSCSWACRRPGRAIFVCPADRGPGSRAGPGSAWPARSPPAERRPAGPRECRSSCRPRPRTILCRKTTWSCHSRTATLQFRHARQRLRPRRSARDSAWRTACGSRSGRAGTRPRSRPATAPS